ncbi:7-cyano-7-deazaguanine synthase QueC [Planctomycetota bacterium]
MTDASQTPSAALVILSGGQDSTVCLGWARNRYDSVHALTFDYGQTHSREIECARAIAAATETPHEVIAIDLFRNVGISSLIEGGSAHAHAGLPVTFVPGRNLIFLTHAAVWAYKMGIRDLVAGVSQVDYSGYPDCREDALKALEQSLRLGMDYEINIITPLIDCSKGEVVALARQEDCLDLMALTHTCYRGEEKPCGECDACILRAKGFEEAGIDDPLVEGGKTRILAPWASKVIRVLGDWGIREMMGNSLFLNGSLSQSSGVPSGREQSSLLSFTTGDTLLTFGDIDCCLGETTFS